MEGTYTCGSLDGSLHVIHVLLLSVGQGRVVTVTQASVVVVRVAAWVLGHCLHSGAVGAVPVWQGY